MQEDQILAVAAAALAIVGLLICVLPALARLMFGARRDTRPGRR